VIAFSIQYMAMAEEDSLQYMTDTYRPHHIYDTECCTVQHIDLCVSSVAVFLHRESNKKAQLSLTNPRDAKACQKLLQFDVLTTLSLIILAYLHSFSCCCVRNLRNPAQFTENSNLWSSRSSKVIDLGVNRKPRYDFLLVTNSNFGRICYCFRDIDGWSWKIADFTNPSRL